MEYLSKMTADPYILPASSELVISDLKLSSRDALKSQSQLNLRQISALIAILIRLVAQVVHVFHQLVQQ